MPAVVGVDRQELGGTYGRTNVPSCMNFRRLMPPKSPSSLTKRFIWVLSTVPNRTHGLPYGMERLGAQAVSQLFNMLHATIVRRSVKEIKRYEP